MCLMYRVITDPYKTLSKAVEAVGVLRHDGMSAYVTSNVGKYYACVGKPCKTKAEAEKLIKKSSVKLFIVKQ